MVKGKITVEIRCATRKSVNWMSYVQGVIKPAVSSAVSYPTMRSWRQEGVKRWGQM